MMRTMTRYNLRALADYLSEHPLLAERGVNGEEVQRVLAAVGQYFRAHPAEYPSFTAAVLERAGTHTPVQHWRATVVAEGPR